MAGGEQQSRQKERPPTRLRRASLSPRLPFVEQNKTGWQQQRQRDNANNGMRQAAMVVKEKPTPAQISQQIAFLGQIFREDELLPGWIPVPDELLLVRQENVGFAVAIDISDGEAVADFDLCIDVNGSGRQRQ